MAEHDGGPAFPSVDLDDYGNRIAWSQEKGLSLRDYFAAAALANPAVCTGHATGRELDGWFGERRVNITTAEIVTRQAFAFADAMIFVRGVK